MKTKFIALCMLPFLLSGCSSTFAYNNLDWLLYWYLDDYVELENDQKQLFDTKLETWLAWHRQQELTKYKKQFSQLQGRLAQGPLTQQDWLEQFDLALSHWYELRQEIGPELIEFSVQLSDQQITGLFEELEKSNLEREEERADTSEQERLEDQIEDTQDRFKNYVGRLTKTQKTLIAEYAPQFRSNFDNWMMYRRSIQGAAQELMMSRHKNPQYSQQLAEILFQPETYQSQEYLKVSEHNRILFAKLLAELHPTLTAKQNKKLIAKITDFIDDLDSLIAKN